MFVLLNNRTAGSVELSILNVVLVVVSENIHISIQLAWRTPRREQDHSPHNFAISNQDKRHWDDCQEPEVDNGDSCGTE